nr:hypothetical protein [Thermobrachium celere]
MSITWKTNCGPVSNKNIPLNGSKKYVTKIVGLGIECINSSYVNCSVDITLI